MKKLFKNLTNKKWFKKWSFSKCFVVTWEMGGRSVKKSAFAAWWASLHSPIQGITYEP